MGFFKVRNKHTGHSVWHRLRLQSGVQGICMAQVKVARRRARYLRIAYSYM